MIWFYPDLKFLLVKLQTTTWREKGNSLQTRRYAAQIQINKHVHIVVFRVGNLIIRSKEKTKKDVRRAHSCVFPACFEKCVAFLFQQALGISHLLLQTIFNFPCLGLHMGLPTHRIPLGKSCGSSLATTHLLFLHCFHEIWLRHLSVLQSMEMDTTTVRETTNQVLQTWTNTNTNRCKNQRRSAKQGSWA